MPTPNTDVKLGVGNVDIVYAIQNLAEAKTASITITSGSTESTVFDMNNKLIVGFIFPAGYDGGNITIKGSDLSAGTYVDVWDSNGSQVTATVATGSRLVSLVGNSLQAVANIPYIKIVAGSAVTADRVIKVLAKG